MPARYPTPWALVPRLAYSALANKKRSFQVDARQCMDRLGVRFQVIGQENIPVRGRTLITLNHYSRPGFQAWWLALAISAHIQREIHWVMTAAWTYADPVLSRLVTPTTRWVFRRLAQVYDFTTMPPMPPREEDFPLRVVSTRRVLHYALINADPVIGLAPEGRDASTPGLVPPPPGVGRLIMRLVGYGFSILPAGIYEDGVSLYLCFGEPYTIPHLETVAGESQDAYASQQVMQHIAQLLPIQLRGAYTGMRP